MKLKFLSIVFISLGVLILSGCGGPPRPGMHKQKTQAVQPKFVIGKTTKEDVIAALGEPNGDSFNSEGEEVLVYHSTHMTGKAFIPFYHGTDRVRSKMEQYKFKNGILTATAHSSNHY